ncbi:MAG TPA: hypothetical protein VFA74_05225 [Terriglobales bacterium]|nr:hypothetical protein [Terriglobales bacterium]
MTTSNNSRTDSENSPIHPRPMGWRCSTCNELITKVEDGWVEWLSLESEHGATQVKDLRLVHQLAASPRVIAGYGCQYDWHREFQIDQSIVEGLPLERFVGSDGLMLLLSFFADGEMPKGDLLELAKRVQIPGYEQARELFPKAIEAGILEPSIGDGYYLQLEIQTLLNWATR